MVVGFLFLALGVGICVPKLIANARYQNILETGREGVGYNVRMHDSGMSINEEPRFYLTFDYYDDVSATQKSGKTSDAYTEIEAYNLVYAGKLPIIYSENGAIQANFDKKAADRPVYTLLLAFGGMGGFVFVFFGIKFFNIKSKDVSIKLRGVETTGAVIGYTGGKLVVNGVKMYSLSVAFDNQRGEFVEGKTSENYDLPTAENYKNKKVKIMYYGENVEILEVLNPSPSEQ